MWNSFVVINTKNWKGMNSISFIYSFLSLAIRTICVTTGFLSWLIEKKVCKLLTEKTTHPFLCYYESSSNFNKYITTIVNFDRWSVWKLCIWKCYSVFSWVLCLRKYAHSSIDLRGDILGGGGECILSCHPFF